MNLELINILEGNAARIYSLNYKHLIIACDQKIDKEVFLSAMNKICKIFGYSQSDKTGISCVFRFVAVIDVENPVDKAISMLNANRDHQETFLVYDDNQVLDAVYIEEAKVIELLNYAISTNSVIPYYQGIRDNNSGLITRYEALMRIRDREGKVYTPFVFMDLSKKYKYYSRLSKLLITKALSDFENREESISINISYYDIQSSSFRIWMINKLKKFPQPERVIIEFVETENTRGLDVLSEFIYSIKSVGSKIAIDDFGTGYSTFATIVSLNPDYIKIDGSIIGALINNTNNQIILKTISYMAKQMETSTVAEFVDNQSVQDIVESQGVQFSQGFFYSKPQPIEEIF